MKKIISLAVIAGSFTAQSVFAGEVCGKLRALDICGLQNCIIYNLSDPDRGPDANAYLVETNDSNVLSEIKALAAESARDSSLVVCVVGDIGANGDPDQLMATSVHKGN